MSTAHADCIDDAATHHGINALVLRAIGWHESRLRPGAVSHNRNGTIDVGAFQINSVHLPDLARHGIDITMLADGCTSAEVAAWHYRRQVDAYGNTWAAVGAYHSRTPARSAWYADRIADILRGWNATRDARLPYDEQSARGPGVASTPSAATAAAASAVTSTPSVAPVTSVASVTSANSVKAAKSAPAVVRVTETVTRGPASRSEASPAASDDSPTAAPFSTLAFLPPAR